MFLNMSLSTYVEIDTHTQILCLSLCNEICWIIRASSTLLYNAKLFRSDYTNCIPTSSRVLCCCCSITMAACPSFTKLPFVKLAHCASYLQFPLLLRLSTCLHYWPFGFLLLWRSLFSLLPVCLLDFFLIDL